MSVMFRLRYLSIGLMVASAGSAWGQAYPSKPIRIVTSEAGGGADFVARMITPGLSASLGRQVIVDNRGSGVIPGETVARALPDGYTLLMHGGGFWLAPLLRSGVQFDPLKDFSAITLTSASPVLLVVHSSLPVKSVKDLITLAKSRPGDLNYASSSSSSASNLAGALFKYMAQVNIVSINYNGNGAAVNGLLSGEVQLMFASSALATPHVKSGRLRAIAVGSLQPSTLAPGLPTIADSGLPGYEATSRFGLFTPIKTPDAIIARLNQETIRVLNQPDVKEKLFRAGLETVGNSPEQFTAMLRTEIARMAKVISDSGIKAD